MFEHISGNLLLKRIIGGISLLVELIRIFRAY
jgi:hypothetical protein